jgi:hypothetical protein
VLVIDTKQYRGRLRLDRYGFLWHGRHLLVCTLRNVLWEADQADEVLGVANITVGAIVAVHSASVPWGRLQADGVTIAPARRVPTCYARCHRSLGPSGRAGGLAGRPSPTAVPRRRLTACTFRLRKRDCCFTRPHLDRCLMRLTAFDQGRLRALLSSDDFGSSVERTGRRHPLWRVLRSVA